MSVMLSTVAFTAAQQDAMRKAVALYWGYVQQYEARLAHAAQDVGKVVNPEVYYDRQWHEFVRGVAPIIRAIHHTYGKAGLAFAAHELARLGHPSGHPVPVGWWAGLIRQRSDHNPRWHPSGDAKAVSRRIKLDVAPEHRQPLARLAGQFVHTRDEITRQYLVQRMFEIGGVAGVDYAAELIGVSAPTLYEYYPLHISRAIRSGRSGRNAGRKRPTGRRQHVAKAHWQWANDMMQESPGFSLNLGGKRDGHYATRRTTDSLKARQIRQSL